MVTQHPQLGEGGPLVSDRPASQHRGQNVAPITPRPLSCTGGTDLTGCHCSAAH